MKKFPVLMTIVLGLALNAGAARVGSVRNKALQAVGVLFAVHPSNRELPVCTLTAFEQTADGYRVVTAAHCVLKTAGVTGKYFANFPYPQPEHASLKLESVGTSSESGADADDYAVFSYKSKVKRQVIPIGDPAKLQVGDKVVYAGEPGMYGLQWFEGIVSRVRPAEPLLQLDPRPWPKHILVQIAGGPGSSGSALVSLKQGKIVAILTGAQDNSTGSVWFFPVNKSILSRILSKEQLLAKEVPEEREPRNPEHLITIVVSDGVRKPVEVAKPAPQMGFVVVTIGL